MGMMDREKVVKGLVYCTQHGHLCGRDCNGYWGWTDGSHTGMELFGEYRTKCPYGNCETGCVKTLTKDALALLKAQEPDEDWISRKRLRDEIQYYIEEAGWGDEVNKVLGWCLEFIDNQEAVKWE